MNKFRFMAVDDETTGLDWTKDQLHGFAVAYEEDEAKYYPVWDVPQNIREDLANPEIAKIGHNFHGFDAKFLVRAGFEVKGPIDDTMVLAQLSYEPTSLGLKYLAERFIGPESLEKKRRLDRYLSENGCRTIAQLCAKDLADPAHPHTKVIAEYCEEDANNTLKLFFIFVKKLKEMDKTLRERFGFKKTPLDYYKEEARPMESVLLAMELRGVRVNLDAINAIRDEAVAKQNKLDAEMTEILKEPIAKLEKELYEKILATKQTPAARSKVRIGEGKCKFSWGNNNHVGSLFFGSVGIPSALVKRSPKGKYRTDKTYFGELQHLLPKSHVLRQVLPLFAVYKKEQKIASTYTGTSKKGILSKVRMIDGVPRIFPTYRQTTGTGRLACKNPNLQNLKRNSPVKKFFIPDAGYFEHDDYSQVELRIAAHESQDSKLLKAYRTGVDVHCETATSLFQREITKSDDLERQVGKRTNFLTIYDGGWSRLRESLKQDTGKEFEPDDCKEFIARFFERYQEYRTYLDSQLEFVTKHKFVISSTGRIKRCPDIIYGEGINYKRKRFLGSKELHQKLRQELAMKLKRAPSEEEIMWQAHKKFKHALKQAYNAPIQGLGASITKRAMIALHAAGYDLVNQVHDSLDIERRGTPKPSKKIKKILETVYPLTVPVVADCKLLKSFDEGDSALSKEVQNDTILKKRSKSARRAA